MWSVWTGDESNSAFDVEQQVRFDAGQTFFLLLFFLPFLFVFLYLLNVNLSDFNMVLAKDTKLQRCDVLGICKKNENPRVLCIIWYYGNNCTIQYLGCLWTTTFRFFLGVLFVQSVVKEWFPYVSFEPWDV